MGPETCVIVNPAASRAEEALGTLSRHESLRECDIQFSRGEGNAAEKARWASEHGYELVVAAGGDGTLNEVVNGVGISDPPTLGLLPLGTANDFARSLGVPVDVESALKVLARADRVPVDAVRVSASERDRLFVNVSAGGFSGAVDEELDETVKQTWGSFAYLETALGAVTEMEVYELVARFDRGEEERFEALNVAAANGRYVAGGIPIAPEARLDDGLIDIVILGRGELPALATLAPRLLLGEHLDDELIEHRRVRHLELSAQPPMLFNVDGELFTEGDVRYEVIPRAFRFIRGDREERVPTDSAAA